MIRLTLKKRIVGLVSISIILIPIISFSATYNRNQIGEIESDINSEPIEIKPVPIEPEVSPPPLDTLKFLIELWEDQYEGRDFHGMIKELEIEKNPDYRGDIVFYLGQSYDTLAIEPLISVLFNDEWGMVRSKAANALVTLGVGKRRGFGENYRWQFVVTKFGEDMAEALIKYRREKIIPALRMSTKDKDMLVVFNAAKGLIALGDTTSGLHVMGDVFRKINFENWEFGFLPRPDLSEEEIRKVEEDQRNFIQGLPKEALKFILEIGNEDAIEILTVALDDEDEWVRCEAESALRKIKEGKGYAH